MSKRPRTLVLSIDDLRRDYVALGVLVLNSILVFAVLNILIWGAGTVDSDLTEVATPDPRDVYIPAAKLTVLNTDFDALRQFYYYRTDPEIFRLLLEGMGLEFVCDRDTIFRVKPRAGDYYNITAAGYRVVSPQGEWPPDEEAYNIFVFGDSTIYGAGVEDNLTIASWLQDHLRQALNRDDVFVYNFGVPSFTSLLERWRFEALLRDGFLPDLAVFIDGSNEFANYRGLANVVIDSDCEPLLTFSARVGNTVACNFDEACLPIQRFATALNSNLNLSAAEEFQERADFALEPEAPPNDEETNRRVIDRWLENKRLIEQQAASHGIQTVFVMQPTAAYAYDLSHHPLMEPGDLSGARVVWGYPLWEDLHSTSDWAQNTLNLIHLGEDNQGPIYLDGVHYTSDFSSEIAQAISDAIVERNLITRAE
jgi:hypothetical protein